MDESCSIEGCERRKWARGWCHPHYLRWHRHGDPLGGRPNNWASNEPCTVEGCDETGRKRGWCERHYQHWWKYGAPTATRLTYDECQIEGCDGKPRSGYSDLCEMHYGRLRRNGHLDLLPRWTETPTYRAAHTRIKQMYGRAAERLCMDCPSRGAHWSFAWRRVAMDQWLWEVVNGSMLAYTGNPDDYEPRCRSCARRYDRDFALQGWTRLEQATQ